MCRDCQGSSIYIHAYIYCCCYECVCVSILTQDMVVKRKLDVGVWKGLNQACEDGDTDTVLSDYSYASSGKRRGRRKQKFQVQLRSLGRTSR